MPQLLVAAYFLMIGKKMLFFFGGWVYNDMRILINICRSSKKCRGISYVLSFKIQK